MSDIIHLLPDSVANQIAAGEVIQRPSSVIKELMENSIDAGATRVQVIVTNAGKSCIQVIDDGQGMSETDARLAFERHATSKISEAKDLFSLHTMGFRGEALASIAAVAQVELRTRISEEELGVSILIEGSNIISQTPITCPVGANFAVKNLFFNIPARRKFLKSNHTELTNILTEFERIALAHPEVAFSLSTNESPMLNLSKGNFRQRIDGIFGKKLNQQLIPIHVETSIIDVEGFIGTPESSKKKGAHQYFFANGRYMRHPYFSKAIQTAYERLIPDNEQIPYFLHLKVDPSHIDVNIHPTKTEIKFEDEQAIWQILLAAARESLGKFNAVPTIDFDTENLPDIPTFSSNRSTQPPQIEIDPTFNPFCPPSDTRSSYSARPINNERGKNAGTASQTDWQQLYGYRNDTDVPATQSQQHKEDALYASLPKEEQTQWEYGEAEYMQYKGRFILSSVKSGLLIVDQHRAHIRVLYDTYLKQMAEKHGASQGLLFPQIIQLSPSQASLLEKIIEQLTSIGFDLSNLGGGSYSILSIPAGTEGIDPVRMLQSLIEDVNENDTNINEEIFHSIALSMATKSAIPIGQELSNKEMQHLVEELFSRQTPNYTPDGKNTLTIIPNQNIEDFFG